MVQNEDNIRKMYDLIYVETSLLITWGMSG